MGGLGSDRANFPSGVAYALTKIGVPVDRVQPSEERKERRLCVICPRRLHNRAGSLQLPVSHKDGGHLRPSLRAGGLWEISVAHL